MDLLSYLPTERHIPVDDIFRAMNEELNKICDSIEAHFVSVGTSINEALRATTWLPNSIKPPPRPLPQRHAPTPLNYLQTCQKLIVEHRAVSAAIVAFVGTSVFIFWRRRRQSQGNKRRARRGKNGSKTEVVILAGSPYSPLTRSLALNLERRGFIVYVLVSDQSEENHVRAESRADIRPLHLDITSPSSSARTLQEFSAYLSQPHSSHLNTLRLTSILLLPASPPPSAPISALHPILFSDTLTAHLLAPVAALHTFLPLLTAQKSSVIFLTPSIIPSLTPPMHAPENVAAAALQKYIQTLRREVGTHGINVVQLQLGTFDYSSESGERSLITTREKMMKPEDLLDTESAPARSWDAAFTFKYPNPRDMVARMSNARVSGSPLRVLHDGVFDVMKRRKGAGGTVFLGRGSRMYDLVSRWVPDGIVGWMLGVSRSGVVDLGKGTWERESLDR